jgi:hypothetical protein
VHVTVTVKYGQMWGESAVIKMNMAHYRMGAQYTASLLRTPSLLLLLMTQFDFALDIQTYHISHAEFKSA